MTDDIFIKFDHVKKSYDGRTFVVKDLNLEIFRGEFLTMLGPSGSGKSTCLMMLSGFDDLTGGAILVSGRPIQNTPSHKRNIGMVFQNYALFPHMTIAQNLAYPLKFRVLNRLEAQNRVDEFLALVRLEKFAHRYPAQLSGGQQQRVALARALIYKPDLVLMDEPLGALDKNLRGQMQYEIKKLHQLLGFTAIYVTHDQSEALTMSDRVLVFNEGVVQQLADTKTIYNQPKNKFVANFIGENNQISAVVETQLNTRVLAKVGEEISLFAFAPNYYPQGKRVELFIRPENLLILNDKNSHAENDNIIKVTIKRIIFIGDHLRIYTEFLSDYMLVIKHHYNQREYLSIGDEITLGFSFEYCIALSA